MSENLTGVESVTGHPPVSRVNAAATTNINVVKASPGNVYGWMLYNTAAYDVFFKFYNKATAPVPASDVPLFTVRVKTMDKEVVHTALGIPFTAGISYAITKLQADTDVTVLVAGDLTGALLTL